MNGSEVLTQGRNPVAPGFGYNRIPELTEPEKMDLTVFSSMSLAKAVYKVMEIEILEALHEAMQTNPANKEQQVANMTIAHAMDKFYTNVRGKIEHAMGEHVATVRLKVQEEDLKDAARMEEIILQNATGIQK